MEMQRCAAPALLLLFLVLAPTPLIAQVCRLSVAGVNDSRRVMGPVHAECPGSIHTAPFGNWGVTSNFGSRRDGHQFDGWCHNSYVCDNWRNCKTECKESWYEWNSCTDISRYTKPNCYLYNSANCTEQVTRTGANVLGTVYMDARVSCPYDSNSDGFCDTGGCMDVSSLTLTNGYMSLYELDWTGGELIQTMYFGPATVNQSCDPWNCGLAGSTWASPIYYDSPSSPAKAYADLAMVINWGAFVDPYGVCSYYARYDRRFACH